MKTNHIYTIDYTRYNANDNRLPCSGEGLISPSFKVNIKALTFNDACIKFFKTHKDNNRFSYEVNPNFCQIDGKYANIPFNYDVDRFRLS